MKNNALIRLIVVGLALPSVIISILFVAYSLIIAKHDKLSDIANKQSFYKTILLEDAQSALTLGDTENFKRRIDSFITHESNYILSIMLINNKNTIIASAPEKLDFTIPGVQVPVRVNVSGSDRFDIEPNSSENEIVGYIVIRYNKQLTDNAINIILFRLAGFLLIVAVLVAGSYAFLIKKVVNPINRVIDRMSPVADRSIETVSNYNDFMSPIDLVVNNLVKENENSENIIASLQQQLAHTRSNVDIANLTKIELMSELIDNLDEPLTKTNEMIARLSSLNTTHNIALMVLAGNVGRINKIIANTKCMVNSAGMEMRQEPIKIEDFINGIKKYIDAGRVSPAFHCDPSKLNDYLQIDDIHFYQLVGKVAALAAFTGNKNSMIHLTTSVEFDDKGRVIIAVEIKDTSDGLNEEMAMAFNQYMNKEIRDFTIEGYPDDELRLIKYLSNEGNAYVSMRSEYARGNYYKIFMSRGTTVTDEINTHTAGAASCCVVHTEEHDPQLREHFRSIGIKMNYVPLYKAAHSMRVIGENDFVVVEFSEDTQVSLMLCRDLYNTYSNICIIAAMSSTHSNDEMLIESLMKHVKGIIPKPYNVDAIIQALRLVKNNKIIMQKILSGFIPD